MSELQEKVKKSIERLQAFCPEEGYYLAFSGGKDSVVCKALLDMSGCKYDATYRVTSVDPPELVRFIKEQHQDVIRDIPRYPDNYKNKKLAGKPITMWNLIPEQGFPPTRIQRYCCKKLKESGGDGRITVTGVRWAESVNRKKNQGIVTVMSPNKETADDLVVNSGFERTKKTGVVLTNDNTENRRLVESCFKRSKTTVNPIIDWSDSDVWTFIRKNRIPYCSLYDEGMHRLGCIGCPMASRRERERQFLRWSKYKDAYLLAFQRMLDRKKAKGKPFRKLSDDGGEAKAQDIYKWWMGYDILPGQISFDDYEEDED